MADDTKFMTPIFRLSYPNLFVAKAGPEGGKEKFSCTAIWRPAKFSELDKKRWEDLLGAMDAMTTAAFKKSWHDTWPSSWKKGIRDGAEREESAGYGKGTHFATLGSIHEPGVVGPDPKIKIHPSQSNAEEIYAGCYCRAYVSLYTFDNVGKGIALGLRAIQKVADGERLDSAGADASNVFGGESIPDWAEQYESPVGDDSGTPF